VVDPTRWRELFDQVVGRVAGRFARVEPRRHAKAFVGGLLSDLPRRTAGRSLSTPGTTAPTGWEHLLARAVWTKTRSATTSAARWSST
jgi:hypothetical protein